MKKILQSAIRQRQYLIKKGKSKRMNAIAALKHFKNWLTAYPKATDEACTNVVMQHWKKFETMVPGNKSGKSLIRKANQLLNQ